MFNVVHRKIKEHFDGTQLSMGFAIRTRKIVDSPFQLSHSKCIEGFGYFRGNINSRFLCMKRDMFILSVSSLGIWLSRES